MSYLLNLYNTFESNLSRVGKIERDINGKEFTLLPISHTTQTAHIEVFVTEEGEFHSAFVVDNNDAITLIPCSEDSASRSNNNAPHPLHDKLIYVAGDYVLFTDVNNAEKKFEKYIRNLKDWIESEYSHPKVESIYSYLKKRQLIKDLIDEHVLLLDEKGKLIKKWNKEYEVILKKKPEIFKVVPNGEQINAFIRFNVYSPEKVNVKIWHDDEVINSFINYYNEKLSVSDFCYVSGRILPITEKHTAKIRHPGDMAKLISSNEDKGFTYTGRFNDSEEVARISYDVSQKAHNALKWLINRQGKMIDGRVFLVWGNTEINIPSPIEDSLDIYELFDGKNEENEIIKSYVHEDVAREVSKALGGFKAKLEENEQVNILVLDSATTGRMAVLYYRNLDIDLYFDRLTNWHNRCYWRHTYKKNKDKNIITFDGAPSAKDIAFAAYGPRADDKVIKGLMERILPSIIDGHEIPHDIVRSAYYRAINPVAYEKWEWEKILSITCALINHMEKGGYEVRIDDKINDRSYLFGRLLAIADVLERNALSADEKRATNAIRYMNAFARHPERTWRIIQEALQPYQARLGSRANHFSKLIDEVASRIKYKDFNNKPLTGKFLLGFYSQRHDLYQKKENKEKTEGGTE